MQLEVNRMQGEMSVERSKMEGLEMALEERRRALEMAEDALQRKRKKYKGRKAMQGGGGHRAQLMCSACRHPTLFSPLPGGSFRSLNLSFPFRGD